MKILLVQADQEKHDEYGDRKRRTRCAYAPTTLTSLASLVPADLGAEVRIVDEGVESLPRNLEADLVGISCTTANALRAYELARWGRAQGMKVVLGGYHPTLMPEEAARHADAVVIGYAEVSWPQLLRDFARGELKPIYRQSGKSAFCKDLPVPRRELLRRGSYLSDKTLEATRGCPNQCDYCVISAAHGRECWLRPVGEVVAEVRSLKARRIIFLDSNPTEFPDYARELCSALAPLKIKWSCASTPRALKDPQWLSLASRSGLECVLIGFESIVQDSLTRHNKAFNQVEEFREMIRALHDHGIAVLGCFVFGLEDDDPGVFRRTVEFVNQAQVDIVQYAIYTPFPGTKVFRALDEQGRITSKDWRLYDGKHVIFRPAAMTAEELWRGFHRATAETYRMASIRRRIRTAGPLKRAALFWVNLGFRKIGIKIRPPGILSDG